MAIKVKGIEFFVPAILYFEIPRKNERIDEALEILKKNPIKYINKEVSEIIFDKNEIQINLRISCPGCGSEILLPIIDSPHPCPRCNTEIEFCPLGKGGCDLCDERIDCLTNPNLALSPPYPK
jgi:hypothetical protein